jgi:putative oxidoreductase
LQVTPHDSGSLWVATPLPYDFFIHYNLAALAGAQKKKWQSLVQLFQRDRKQWVFGSEPRHLTGTVPVRSHLPAVRADAFSGQTIVYAASQGVPLASLAVPLSGVIALAGGLSILLGYRARIGAWLVVLFLAAVTPMLHKFWAISDPMMHQMQFLMFMKNVSMLGGALLITQLGPGPWSLDAQRK